MGAMDGDHGVTTSRPGPSGPLVVAVDPTRPRNEVPLAAAVAAQSNQTMDLVAVARGGVDRSAADAVLRESVAIARDAGARTIAWEVLDGADPARTVLDHLATTGASLLAMGTRARTPLRELLLGSVSEALLREATIPVLFAGPRSHPPGRPYRRVVACVDDSLTGEEVAVTADLLAERAAVPVETFRAAPEGWGDPDLDLLAAPPALAGEAAVAAVLAHLGDDPATVAVVGTEARRGLDRLLFASVAMGITRRAAGPVVVLPPTLLAAATPALAS